MLCDSPSSGLLPANAIGRLWHTWLLVVSWDPRCVFQVRGEQRLPPFSLSLSLSLSASVLVFLLVLLSLSASGAVSLGPSSLSLCLCLFLLLSLQVFLSLSPSQTGSAVESWANVSPSQSLSFSICTLRVEVGSLASLVSKDL